MKVTRYLGCGLLAASAALLIADAANAQFTPYAPPQQQAAVYQQQPYGQRPTQGYNVPQGYAPRVAMNYQAPPADPGAMPSPGADGNTAGMPAPTPVPAPAYQNYPAAGCPNGGCSTGTNGAGCYGAPSGNYGCGDVGYNTYGCGYGAGHGGLRASRANHCGGGYGQGGSGWFGGVYGLLMERDRGPNVPLVFVGDGTLVDGDYPSSDAIVLNTRDVDIGFQAGFEARIGKWLGGNDGRCNCGPQWGIEGVYWGLFEDDATAQYSDSGTLTIPNTARIYSMIDPRGLEYDNGGGYRPVRDYFDYGPPVQPDNPAFPADVIRVDVARVRSSFEVHNVEVNLLRVGCGGGCYSGAGACGVGGAACGGDYAGCDAGGCTSGGRGGYGGSRFSCTGVCGFRYMQFTEDFMYGVDFRNTTTAATGFLNYRADVTNDLYGFQLGCRGLYRLGCSGKWGFNLASNVGIYGNDIEVWQRMDSPTGNVRFISTGEDFDVRASKTDVAMVGEIRAGLSYQYNCNTRLYGGWRALGVTGIALATDQAPSAFIDAAQLANYINSNNSLILHGLQAGVEWNY